MAAWWELAIPVGGTLLGALAGSWAQGRNGIRLLKLQNAEAERASRDRNEHERAMKLLEDKRTQYFEFLAQIDKYERVKDGNPAIASKRPKEERDALVAAMDQVEASFRSMYFIAAPEVLEVADKLYMAVIEEIDIIPGGLTNRYVEVARKDLGVGWQLPINWVVDRESSTTESDTSDGLG